MTAVEKKKKRSAPQAPEYVMDAEIVPMPEKKRIGAKKIYFPLDVLELGRSFTTRRSIDTVRSAIKRFREEFGEDKQFMKEKQPDGKVRCWREK